MAGSTEELTQRQRAAWSAGAYADIARTIEAVSDVVVAESEAWLDYIERVLGPVVLAKAALQERWPAARADMVELYERFNESDDGSLRAEPEYLLTLVR